MNLEILQAKVLITVKTYPTPSSRYGELVCTAGLLDGEQWVRVYPIPFRFLSDGQQYPKYSWITLDLVRRTQDFRPESYRPRRGIGEPIQVSEKLGTQNQWAARKAYVLKDVFTSMNELIAHARSEKWTSLATLKPAEIVALFWNCLRQTDGDEAAANELVRQKYLTTFREKNDLYLFLGTTLQHHLRARNPFIIIGVFYPPKNPQLPLF